MPSWKTEEPGGALLETHRDRIYALQLRLHRLLSLLPKPSHSTPPPTEDGWRVRMLGSLTRSARACIDLIEQERCGAGISTSRKETDNFFALPSPSAAPDQQAIHQYRQQHLRDTYRTLQRDVGIATQWLRAALAASDSSIPVACVGSRPALLANISEPSRPPALVLNDWREGNDTLPSPSVTVVFSSASASSVSPRL